MLLGSLAIGVTAGVDKAVGGFKELKASITDLGNGIRSVTTSIAGIGTTLAGIAGVAGLTALVKSSFETIDATGKMADKLGLSTESLIALTHQGELAAVSQETLGKAIQKMVKNIDDAASGSKEAMETFESLKLDPKQLGAGSAEAAYKQIADAIKGVDGAQQQLAATTNIFGQRAAALLPLLRQGAAGFEAAKVEAARLGISLSDIDSLQVQEANDAVTRMHGAITGLANQIAIGLSPIISQAALTTQNWIQDSTRGADLVSTSFRSVVEIVGVMADVLYAAQIVWKSLRIAAAGFISIVPAGIATIIYGIQKLNEALGITDTEFGKVTSGVLDDLNAMTQALNEDVEKTAGEIKDLWNSPLPSTGIKERMEEFAELSRRAAEEAAKVQKTVREAAAAAGGEKPFEVVKWNAKENPVSKIFEDLDKDLAKLTLPDLGQFIEQLVEAGSTTEQLVKGIAKFQEIAAKKESLHIWQETKSLLEEIQSPADRLAERIRDINKLGDAITADQRNAAIVKARDDIFGAGNLQVPEAPRSLQLGSLEARSAELEAVRRAQAGSDRRDIQRRQIQAAEAAAKNTSKMTKQLDDLKKQLGIVVVDE